jgi:hypothetical protein
MYFPATDTTTGLNNSSTPMSQARIDAQNNRVARKGAQFTNGNQDMAAIIAALTPPPATSSCDNLTNSLALRGPANPFPAPSPYAFKAAGAASPTIIAPPVLALPSSTSASAIPASGSSTTTTTPGAVASPAAPPAGYATRPSGGRRRGWPGGGCFGLGAAASLAPRRFRPRGFMGLGQASAPYYHGGVPVTLIDGTVISDPANTTPTDAQCLPFSCFADKGLNLAARYWCAFYGKQNSYNACENPACAPWKTQSGICPSTAATAQPAPAPPPAPSTTGLYPQAPVLGPVAPTFPGFPCNGNAARAATKRAAEAGSPNCLLQVGIGAGALMAILWLFNGGKA